MKIHDKICFNSNISYLLSNKMQSVLLFLIEVQKRATTHLQIKSWLIFVLSLTGLMKGTFFDTLCKIECNK